MNFLWKGLQCIFVWKVSCSGEDALKKADVVLAQSFGTHSDGDCGCSNKALARIVENICHTLQLPSVIQIEIDECLKSIIPGDVVEEHRVEGKYLDTYEVLVQAGEVCNVKGWNKVIVIAHPHHMWRVAMTAKRLGFHVLAVDTCSVPYDSESDQVWTRSWIQFIPREIGARFFYLLKGWI